MATTKYNTSITILRRKELEELIGLKRSTIYDRLDPKSPRYDKHFPRPIKLGPNSIGWILSEVESYIENRIIERNISLVV